ncbi:MAG: DNA repair protein RecO [Bacillota bacterium]|nr:DNA repair protein RecO [Bacillota bacterium]
MASYKVEAVVLKTYDLGEADKILVLFTRESGRVSAVAKGSRKPKSKSAGGAQAFGHNVYLLHKGRNLDIVAQYEIVRQYRQIRGDLDRLAYASYAADLVFHTSHERDPAPEVFDLLVWILDTIEGGRNPEVAAHVFELRLMESLGYRPQLGRCVICGREVSGPARFSSEAGGMLCANCRQGAAGARQVSEGTLRSLRLLQDSDDAGWQSLGLAGEVLREVRAVLDDYITYRLEKRPASLEFLRSLNESK